MTGDVNIDCAEAVKDAINAAVTAGAPFALRFVAIRDYVPEFDMAELEKQGLQVVVTNITHGPVNAARRGNSHAVGIVVTVIQKLKSTAREEIDPLIAFVGQLKDVCGGSILIGDQTVPGNLQPEPLFDAEKLIKLWFWSKFTVTLSVTVR